MLASAQTRPEIHLFAAKFKEQTADVEGARAEYELLLSTLAPGLVEAVVHQANMERRQVGFCLDSPVRSRLDLTASIDLAAQSF